MLTQLPEYLTNKKRIEEITSEWKLQKSKDTKIGKVELWRFKDGVTWSHDYCIKVNDEVKLLFDDDERDKYSAAMTAYYAITTILEM